MIHRHQVQKGLQASKRIKNVIAVGSGKGGVGKSTVAANLALALSKEGAAVGLLDADIYGPSQPHMFGEPAKAAVQDKRFQPLKRHGIELISIGYLVDTEAAMIWRGPMVSGALQQLFNDTDWSELDYLIIDLPPGTGDIQLTLAQKIPVSGAVVVTTPQDIALADVQRAIKMFEKVDIPVLGMVENMSTHLCDNCGHASAIFGQGGAEQMAREHGIKLLGQLPLDARICQHSDAGTPIVAAEPDSDIAAAYLALARQTAATLALRPRDYTSKFPNVVVSTN